MHPTDRGHDRVSRGGRRGSRSGSRPDIGRNMEENWRSQTREESPSQSYIRPASRMSTLSEETESRPSSPRPGWEVSKDWTKDKRPMSPSIPRTGTPSRSRRSSSGSARFEGRTDPAYMKMDWHRDESPDPSLLRNRNFQSRPEIFKSNEIREGMFVWASNPEFENYSRFFGHNLLSRDKQESIGSVKHLELVVSVHAPTNEHPRPHVRTIMLTSFGNAGSLENAKVYKDKMKYCVPHAPAGKEINEQHDPVPFEIYSGQKKIGWLLVHKLGIIEADDYDVYEIVRSNISEQNIKLLRDLAIKNEMHLKKKDQATGSEGGTSAGASGKAKDPSKMDSWRRQGE